MPPDARLVLGGVDWTTYVRLADAPGNAGFKFAFDEPTGRLEIEMPNGFLHESVSRRINDLLRIFTRERGFRTRAAGGTSLRRPGEGGADGDEAYYIERLDRLTNPTMNVPDLAGGDPPPDLVVEVDVTSPGVSKLPIYARLGVGEVWVWTNGEIVCRRLNDAGIYEVTAESEALPGFPLAFVSRLIREGAATADEELLNAMAIHLRADG